MTKSRRPKVLHIYKDFWPPVIGGAEKSINLMCHAVIDEFEPHVLVSNRQGRTESEIADGFPVTKAATFGRWLSAPMTPGLAGWIRRLEADILHVHVPNPTAEISILLARPKTPVVVTWHSDVVRQAWAMKFYQPLFHRFLRRVDRILPTTPDYMNSSPHLRSFLDKCEPVPLAIDVKAFSLRSGEADAVARLRSGRRRPVIAFVGRLRYYKGLHFLIRAMRAIDADLWIIGEGPERERLETEARKARVAERVGFIGDVSDDDLRLRLHAADVYCLPSHLRSEAFGLNQVEAMACGLPVVSTRVGGVGWVNKDGESGIVVPPGDSAALADAINRLLGDAGLRARLGEGAWNRAQKEFTVQRLGENLKSVYGAVMRNTDKP